MITVPNRPPAGEQSGVKLSNCLAFTRFLSFLKKNFFYLFTESIDSITGSSRLNK
jgi:hypothetical protein